MDEFTSTVYTDLSKPEHTAALFVVAVTNYICDKNLSLSYDSILKNAPNS